MRLLLALIVALIIVDGYFYDWHYSRLARDQAMELIDRFRPEEGRRT